MEEEGKVEVVIEKKSEKNKFFTWIDEHPKAVFGIRLGLWVTFSAVLPFTFIAWRYGIFTSESKIKLTGWGFVAVIIVAVFLISLVRYIYKGLKPGLAKQCISGMIAIVAPLILLYLLINAVEDSLNIFKQALGCTILCEAIGIPLNPFPAWLEKRTEEDGEEKADKLSDVFWNKFFKKKKENKDD